MAPESPQRIESKEVALTSTGSWTATIVFFVFSVGFFLLALFAIRDIGAILISGFFATWGVVGMVMMIRVGASQRRYGPIPLELEGPAPAIGGHLRALLQLTAAATRAPLSLRAVLTCSKVSYGDKQSRSEVPLQGLRKVVAVAGDSSDAWVTFDFEIPADLPHSNDPGALAATEGTSYTAWELKVEALGDDVKLSRSYDIPVGRATSAVTHGAAPAPAPREEPMEIVRAPVRAAAPAAVTTAREPEVTLPAPAPLPEAEDDQKSLWVLVTINLVPLAGVLFAGWQVHEIVFLYWIENLVIGVVNVLRMRIAVPYNLPSLARRGVEPAGNEMFMAKAALIGFFIMHYGAFCYGHGTFLASFFPSEQGASQELGGVLRAMLLNPATLVAITAIVLSHAYSYFHNYLGRGEYLRADVGKMMFQPYKRIVVTHLFIFAGGIALLGLGSPVVAMIAFIVIKIAMDAYMHRQERQQLAPSG